MQGLLVVDDLHPSTAQYIGRSHQHRVPDRRGDLPSLLKTGGGAELRRGESGVDQHLAEPATILGQINGLGPGPDDRHAGVGQPLGESERCLPTELDDHAHHAGTTCTGTGFGMENLENVFKRQRFEVQPIGGVVVG